MDYSTPVLKNRLLVDLYRMIFRKDAPYWLRRKSLLHLFFTPVRKFCVVIIIPSLPFNGLRILLYRLMGFRIGSNVFIGMKCFLDDTHPELISIGDNTTISFLCTLIVHGRTRSSWETAPVRIEDNVYVGANSIILKGVTIGRNAVIGAGSVVTKDVAEYVIVAGNPAKPL